MYYQKHGMREIGVAAHVLVADRLHIRRSVCGPGGALRLHVRRRSLRPHEGLFWRPWHSLDATGSRLPESTRSADDMARPSCATSERCSVSSSPFGAASERCPQAHPGCRRKEEDRRVHSSRQGRSSSSSRRSARLGTAGRYQSSALICKRPARKRCTAARPAASRRRYPLMASVPVISATHTTA